MPDLHFYLEYLSEHLAKISEKAIESVSSYGTKFKACPIVHTVEYTVVQ